MAPDGQGLGGQGTVGQGTVGQGTVRQGTVGQGPAASPALATAERHLLPLVERSLPPERRAAASRRDLAHLVGGLLDRVTDAKGITLSVAEQRTLVLRMVERLASGAAAAVDPVVTAAMPEDDGRAASTRLRIEAARARLQPVLMEQIDIAAASALGREELRRQVVDLVGEIGSEQRLQLTAAEQRLLADELVDDMIGLGPLEPLLADDSINDILVNGPGQVYVERRGRLVLTDIRFRDNDHVMRVATRIVTRIGRRIDESNPLVDARLEDGSRVNIIAPPLALDGTAISIRKFAKKSITLDVMAEQENVSRPLAEMLKIAARCRLNILISGGTGSGKTTLLNAMSRLIDNGERVVTIEDAAELQLQQPHVVRLETRPPNLEGGGEITMRHLLKNALRMRPDRIILGEVRGGEAIDMLQAMNTGHDGSMCTLHANTPREALTRLENMVAMSGVTLSSQAVRRQIADAVQLIVQIARMRDGVRRITRVAEVVGMEGEIITLKELFTFTYSGEERGGRLAGTFQSAGFRPHFLPRAAHFGLDARLLEVLGCAS